MSAREEKNTVKITEREREVLQWSAEGYNTKEIAGILFISQDTVDKRSRSITKKLEAKNMKQAVAIGIRKAIIK